MVFKKEELVDLEAFINAFKEHMKRNADFDEWELSMLEHDLKDPYNTPYIMQDYVGNMVIDGVEYEVMSCHTDFYTCGLWSLMDVPCFNFYMLIDCRSLEDGTAAAYTKARKVYVV